MASYIPNTCLPYTLFLSRSLNEIKLGLLNKTGSLNWEGAGIGEKRGGENQKVLGITDKFYHKSVEINFSKYTLLAL